MVDSVINNLPGVAFRPTPADKVVGSQLRLCSIAPFAPTPVNKISAINEAALAIKAC